MSRAIMQQALDALNTCDWDYDSDESPHKTFDEDLVNAAAAALKEALAEPEQEAVCDKDPFYCWSIRCQVGKVCKHTAPPKRAWAGLTDDEIDQIAAEVCFGYIDVARAIEAKLKEKNT